MKIKTTIITALLLLAMVSGAVAQEKWEYAIVQMRLDVLNVTVCKNGDTFQEEKIAKGDWKGSGDFNSLLKKVNEMTDEGWEVFSTDRYENVIVYHLRKNKQ